MQHLLQKIGRWALLASLTLSGLSVGAASGNEKKAPSSVAVAAPTGVDELLVMLPDSDVVALIDVQRAFTELLPKLKTISAGGIGKTATEIETFARLAGVEPKQIQAAVLGLKMTETLSRGSGVLLLQGIEVDVQRLGEAAKAMDGELKPAEHNGKPLYTLRVKPHPNGQADELHFAPLGNQRLAIGDLPAIQGVLAGGTTNAQQVTLGKALKETKTTGLVRFAGNLPEALRAMLASQGELFAQVAAVKAIFGSFDLNGDNSATLDARLRTASNNDATQLKESLNGLIALGKAFLTGNESQTMQLIGKMLDQVKIGVDARDVSLLLLLPKEMMDSLGK